MLCKRAAKIVAFTQPDSTIETSVIDLLSVPSGQQVIWKLTDLLGRKDITSAISFLRHRYDRGRIRMGWGGIAECGQNIAPHLDGVARRDIRT